MATDKVKVAHIAESAVTGATILAPLLRRQIQVGYQVDMVSAGGRFVDDVIATGARFQEIPFARNYVSVRHLSVLRRLIILFRSERYDVVHVHTPIAGVLGRLAAAIARVPITIHHLRGSVWDSGSPRLELLYTAIERGCSRLTTHTFTINCSDAEELVRRNFRPADSVTCLHCGSIGVDTDRFHPQKVSTDEIESLRFELGLTTSGPIIGYIGRLIKRKGGEELLRAFELVAASRPDIRLLIVGDSEDVEGDLVTTKRIKDLVAGSSILRDKVVFTHFRRDTPQLLALMDIIALPSHYEGFGMVLAEAASMGKPVISTTTRGGREAVADGETGILVPPHSVEDLAHALAKLLDDKDLRSQYGTAGRVRAVKHLDENVVFERVQLVYNQLLA